MQKRREGKKWERAAEEAADEAEEEPQLDDDVSGRQAEQVLCAAHADFGGAAGGEVLRGRRRGRRHKGEFGTKKGTAGEELARARLPLPQGGVGAKGAAELASD